MKSIVLEAIAALLLFTTVAMGQQPLTPFPQSANPSLTNNESTEKSLYVTNHDLPPAMAANNANTNAETTAATLGSPFPSIANPSRGETTNSDSSLSVAGRSYDAKSPFPASANPSE
jgi:hypothetical protein